MPADFSEYIDLTPFDVQPGDVYLNAIETARLSLPEFNLRIGSIEDAIFQAMSYLTAVNVASVNRLPSRLMAGILSMMGIQRSEGIPAELELEIIADSYDGATVPQGTIFSFQATFEDEIQEYVFEATETLVIASVTPGVSVPLPSGVIKTQCITPGFIAIVPENSELTILSSGLSIISAIATDSFSNGTNPDTDAEYLSRSVSYLSSLSNANNKASHIDSYIATNYPAVVARVKAYDLTYGDTELGNISSYRIAYPSLSQSSSANCTLTFPSDHQFNTGEYVSVGGVGSRFDSTGTNLYEIISTTSNSITYQLGGTVNGSASVPNGASVQTGLDKAGYVTVFVYGFNEFVSESDKTTIITDVANRSVAGLTFDILSPDLLTLSVQGEVVLDAAYDQVPLQESVNNAIINYLSPLVFPYTEDRVRKTSLVAIISKVPGVIYVKSLTISALGSGWLPQVDDDLVFQNKGALPNIDSEDVSISFTSMTV